jgi:hypothetical protein
MRRAAAWAALLVLVVSGCSGDEAPSNGAEEDASGEQAPSSGDGGGAAEGEDATARTDAGDERAADVDAVADSGADSGNGCFLDTVGVFGECMTTSACAALGKHTSTPGYCPGSASVECCTLTPSVADDPPVPAGWKLMKDSAVTPDMTAWAVSILHDPVTYPMFSTTTRTFGPLDVLARVEWHPPDFQNGVVHRGVTLYQPA